VNTHTHTHTNTCTHTHTHKYIHTHTIDDPIPSEVKGLANDFRTSANELVELLDLTKPTTARLKVPPTLTLTLTHTHSLTLSHM